MALEQNVYEPEQTAHHTQSKSHSSTFTMYTVLFSTRKESFIFYKNDEFIWSWIFKYRYLPVHLYVML